MSIVSLVAWWMIRGDRELVQYALYAAILADIFAVLPTIAYVWKNPLDDRPGAWAMFAFAYSLTIFAISDHTFANYILPIYMFTGALSVAALLALPRIKLGTPLKEWI